MTYKLLCNSVHNRKTVSRNRMKFLIKTFLHDFRKRIAVYFLCSRCRVVYDTLFRTLNYRRTLFRRNRSDVLNHIGYKICVFNNNLIRLFLAQILKFFKHFFRCSEIQRCLIVSVRKSFVIHKDFSVICALHIHKMHITRCDNGFIILFAKCNNTSV